MYFFGLPSGLQMWSQGLSAFNLFVPVAASGLQWHLVTNFFLLDAIDDISGEGGI
jgi:hypothetical protein